MSDSFFSSDEFLGAIAAACYPGRAWSAELARVTGRTFRILFVDGKPAEQTWLHPFYYEESRPARGEAVRQIPYLRTVSHGLIEAPLLSLALPFQPAPYVDWTRFRDWQDYQAFSHEGLFPAMWKTGAYSARALARQAGEVGFVADDDDPAAHDAIFGWKSAQYRRTGGIDRFLLPAAREIYRGLQLRGVLRVSTLRAGGNVVAGIVGSRWHGRFYARLIAHDPTLARYSPGAILTQRLLRESFEDGDQQFDFLAGGERYKWLYATHARILGPVGRQPLRAKIEHAARRRIGTWRQRRRQDAQARHVPARHAR